MKRSFYLLPLAISCALASQASYGYSCKDSTSIGEIQGEGYKSPFDNQDVIVEGVISSKDYKTKDGFYLLGSSDDNFNTSDGLFIYDKEINKRFSDFKSGLSFKKGMKICLSGTVDEYYGQTQLNSVNVIDVEEDDFSSELSFAFFVKNDEESFYHALSRYENMPVIFGEEDKLYITRNYSFDYTAYKSNMVLSYQAPLIKSTQIFPAESKEEKEQTITNKKKMLYIETVDKPKDGVMPYMNSWGPFGDYLRIGDQVKRLQGVPSYRFGNYHLTLTDDFNMDISDWQRGENRRTEAPKRADKSNLRVASFNVLNYFTESINGDPNPTGQNRGAKGSANFYLQRAKIVNAITEIDADLVGLMEIENNGFTNNSAIRNLVDTLNDKQIDSKNHYAYVIPPQELLNQNKYFGGDAIMVAMIYRPAVVTPEGAAEAIRMPHQKTFINEKNHEVTPRQRDSLLQSFKLNSNGEKLTLVVNHLKSKGSPCWENFNFNDGKTQPKKDDIQGSCAAFRVSAAKVLGDALEKNKGNVLLVGDFNSYGKEDPIRVLTDYQPVEGQRQIFTAKDTGIGESNDTVYQDAMPIERSYGFIDMNVKFNKEKAISYSYSGEQGTLDYALANPILSKKVLSVSDWHINSFESDFFEYGDEHTGSLQKSNNPFSASDHDPVIVDLQLGSPNGPTNVKPAENQGGGGSFDPRWLLPLMAFTLSRRMMKRRQS